MARQENDHHHRERISPKKRVSRRNFLIHSALAGLGIAAAGGLTAVLLDRQKPPPFDADQIYTDLRKTMAKNVKEKYNLDQRERFQMKSGVWVTVFSDSDRLQINRQEIERAFLAGFNVLSQQSEGSYKQALSRAKLALDQGKFTGNEVYLLVPGNPASCISKGGSVSPFTLAGANSDNCATYGTTITVIAKEKNVEMAVMPPARFTVTDITAAADHDHAILNPTHTTDTVFQLTASQSAGSTTSHEAIHIWLRMLGEQQAPSEEAFVQTIERDLLRLYQTHPESRPVPFVYR